MGVDETSVRTDELELSFLECLQTVVGEFAEEFYLQRVNRLHIGAGGGNLQADGLPLLREVEHLGHVEKRLRRHATAEDTESAERSRPVDDRRAEAEANGDAGGIEARATSTEN